MAARELPFNGYLSPSGGVALPALAFTPPAGKGGLNFAFALFYVLNSSGATVPFYMPYGQFIQQGTTPATPAAGTAIAYVNTGPTFLVLGPDGQPIQIATRAKTAIPGFYVDGLGMPAAIEAVRLNGTDASPTKVLSGQRLLRLGAGGYHGGSALVFDKAVIDFEADEDWNSATDLPSRILLKAVPDGSGTLGSILGLYGTGQKIKAERNAKSLDTDFYWETRTSVTINNVTNTEQDLVNTALTTADFAVGDRIRFRASGDCLFNSGAPNLSFAFRFGAQNLTMTPVPPTVSANRRHWYADIVVTFVDTIDASCIVQFEGLIVMSNAGTVDIMPVATTQTWVIQKNATGVDLSASTITLRLTTTISVQNAANEVRLREAFVQRLAL